VSPALRLVVDDAESMVELGARLGELLEPGDLVILDGPLGAGKTTLTRGIGEGIGVRGPITSPTFVLARVHPSVIDPPGPALVHVDAYRLESLDDLDGLDLDDSLPDSVTVVEWGAGRVEHLSTQRLVITIERGVGMQDDKRRVIMLEWTGPAWAARLAALQALTQPTA